MSIELVRFVLIFAATSLLMACAGRRLSTREKGTLRGGAVGAASGAIIGSAVRASRADVAFGFPYGTSQLCKIQRSRWSATE